MRQHERAKVHETLPAIFDWEIAAPARSRLARNRTVPHENESRLTESIPFAHLIRYFANPHGVVICGACEGRGSSLDIVEHPDGRRIVLRTVCRGCLGRGVIDITRGPVTGDDYRCSTACGAAHAVVSKGDDYR